MRSSKQMRCARAWLAVLLAAVLSASCNNGASRPPAPYPPTIGVACPAARTRARIAAHSGRLRPKGGAPSMRTVGMHS